MNTFFTHEDEWYLLYGHPLTKEEAQAFTKIQWKISKREIEKVKEKMNSFEKGGIFWKEFRFKYYGLLWKYQELIKIYKVKNKEVIKDEKIFIPKKPKL